MATEKFTRPPREQWWTIRGDEIMAAMHRVAAGENPELIYLEYLANSEITDYGKDNPEETS